MRLLFVVFWVVVLFLLVRPLVRQWQGTKRQRSIRETLVHDPICQTYLPLSRALTRTVGGTTHYFCSSKCAAQFPRRTVTADDS